MTQIRLTNSATRRKEEFTPLDPDHVRVYVCGPTVYDRAHLGNARPVVVFDVLYRLLRHVYGPEHVSYVRNFTDVDDKINARAAESGRPIGAITAETTRWFLDDMAALGALEPSIRGARHDTAMPRATAYIAEMIEMIAGLVADGHAYEAEGHVLFAVESYAGYGALSGRSVDDMIAGARVEVAPYKRNPMDFVLWKPSRDDQPGWDSPWGRGRPGWHIECSAMSHALLGESFDIHGGGNDLMFPHHENEIAQSRCAHPDSGFARVWMHNEMLQVEGRKMSKSLGNFFTVRDLLDRGIPGEVIRFVFLGSHYRKPMDWTEAMVDEARTMLRKWRALTNGLPAAEIDNAVQQALMDDLNTAGAIARLHEIADAVEAGDLEAGVLLSSARIIGLLEPSMGEWVSRETELKDEIEALLRARAAARETGNYAKADAIRGFMQIAGVEIDDGATTRWRPGTRAELLGWLAVQSPALDGKTAISYEEFLYVAEQRGIVVEKEKKGRWKAITAAGYISPVDRRYLELAKREAEA